MVQSFPYIPAHIQACTVIPINSLPYCDTFVTINEPILTYYY